MNQFNTEWHIHKVKRDRQRSRAGFEQHCMVASPLEWKTEREREMTCFATGVRAEEQALRRRKE